MVMVTMNYTTTAASIILDTPIVSIAGSTLSEITTTTTSTKTTPTPVPTSTSNDSNNTKTEIIDDNKVSDVNSFSTTLSSVTVEAPSSIKSTSESPKSMSHSSNASVATVADSNSSKEQKFNNSNVLLDSPSLNKFPNVDITSLSVNTSEKNESDEIHDTAETTSKKLSTTEVKNDVTDETSFASKAETVDRSSCTSNNKKVQSKESLSDSWEECRLKDWDDNQLKELLEEAFHYKTPRDKENKSKTFLQLLKKAENEDPSYPFGTITTRPLSNSIASNNYYNYQKANAHHCLAYNSHNNSQNNNSCSNNNNNTNHRSHHRTHKQGGSLQDLLNEGQSDCDHTFGGTGSSSAVSGSSQRGRRQNHNSRQKKYSSSVSSRQREGGSLPSNVNATYQFSGSTEEAAAVVAAVAIASTTGRIRSVGGASHLNANDIAFFHELSTSVKSNKKDQRRTKTSRAPVVTSTSNNNNTSENKENNQSLTTATQNQSQNTESVTIQLYQKNGNSDTSTESRSVNAIATIITTAATTPNSTVTNARDCIIEIGEQVMDAQQQQQQQQILQNKGQDASTQGILPSYYENLADIDRHIPRGNFVKSKSSSFSPTTYHCCVDENVRFSSLESGDGDDRNGPVSIHSAGNKSQKKSTIGSDTVMSGASVSELSSSSAAATTTTAAVIDTKYLPLDSNYKSCISVLSSDVGDITSDKLGVKPKCITTYPKTVLSNIQTPVTISNGSTSQNAQQHQQQQQPQSQAQIALDENGNALNELYQSVANMGVPSSNVLGNLSTSATVTISAPSHASSSSLSTSALNCNNSGGVVGVTVGSGGIGTTQLKSKSKKKPLQERNTKTVDVVSVAGYRGNDPVEELVKYIESGECGATISKGADKKKDRRKDKEKHQKLKKSNSLEELRSGVKLDLQELKRSAATTESNAVIMRQKHGNKQNKNSSSTADIHKSPDNNKNNNNNGNSMSINQSVTTISTTTTKSDRRSWDNEDLKSMECQQQYVNEKTTSSTSNNSSIHSTATTTRDRQKSKQNAKQANDKEREKDNKESMKDNNAPLQQQKQPHENSISVFENNEQKFSGKLGKSEMKAFDSKIETREKVEKRKKDAISNAVTIVDILAIEPVLPETAEFHVVTKRKKAKKQRPTNNIEDTAMILSRTQNVSIPKTTAVSMVSTTCQGHISGRYRYQAHDTQQSCQENRVVAANSGNDGNNSANNNGKDKSRRKSTSSMPPSEKSDTSDQDSVHSLPIKSTASAVKGASNMVPTTTSTLLMVTDPTVTTVSAAMSSAGIKGTQCKRNKSVRQQQVNNMLTNQNSTIVPTNKTISYADIARNKDVNSNDSPTEVIIPSMDLVAQYNSNGIIHISGSNCGDDDSKMQNASGNTISGKSYKGKKNQQKTDFPELCNSNNNNNNNSTSDGLSSLDQSDVQKQTQKLASNISNRSLELYNNDNNGPQLSTTTVNDNTKVQATDIIKVCSHHNTQQQTQLQNVSNMQRSKNLDHHSCNSHSTNYNNMNNSGANVAPISGANPSNHFNNSISPRMSTYQVTNLDQQYPALEKTVKRHNNNNNSNNNNNNNGVNNNTGTALPGSTGCCSVQNNCVYATDNSSVANGNCGTSSSNSTGLQVTINQSKHTENNGDKKQQQQVAEIRGTENNTINAVGGGDTGIAFHSHSNIKQINLTTSDSLRNNSSSNSSNIHVNVANSRKSKEKSPPTESSTAASSCPLLPSSSDSSNVEITSCGTATAFTRRINLKTTSSTMSSTDTIQHFNATHCRDNTANIVEQPQQATVTITDISSQNQIVKRSKKERQQHQSVHNVSQNANKKLIINNNSTDISSNNNSGNRKYSVNKSTKAQLKSSSLVPINTSDYSSSSSGNYGDTDDHPQCLMAATVNHMKRPAVIILNDDSNRRISNDIVFGDFCEEDRKLLFQDLKHIKEECVSNLIVNNEHHNCAAPSSTPTEMTSIYNHDETTTSNPDSLEIILDSSSANTSSNTSHDYYTTQSLRKSLSVSIGVCANDNCGAMGKQINRQPSPTEDNVNCMLSSSADRYISNSMESIAEISLPQQLETCNEIETAIIAAARAQQRYQEQEQQLIQYKNSKSSSNSSSFSSSSMAASSTATTSITISNYYGNNHVYGASNTYNNHSGSHYNQRHRSLSGHSKRGCYRQMLQSTQQHQNQHNVHSNQHQRHFYDEDIDNDNCSIVTIASTGIDTGDDAYNLNLRTRIHSPGRVCCILISRSSGGPYKELHFIQSPARPITYNQHCRHDQLVDFISSSWDDILNSNGTRMYIDNNSNQ